MSAITGIFYRNGQKIKPEIIKKMNDKLSHRGPDGSAVWSEDNVAFGHQILWTTPESLHEKLPFHDEKSGLVITADARIDNRKELSEELGIEDSEDVSDSYFILKAYQKWGEKCPEHLLGDFAFAIWDEKEEGLFCARDHMGVKPFYYYVSDEGFFFTTEIKALFTIPEIPYELNEVRVAQYLITMHTDREITFFNGISRLPAANWLKVNSNDFIMKKYWHLSPDYEIKMDKPEEYIEKFKEIFTEAVKCRLRSGFNVGSTLSGGLDSSSIACTARNILIEEKREKLKTFSLIFNNLPQCDEREYINTVISKDSIDPYFIRADESGPLVDYEQIFWYEDEAFWAPNLYLRWLLTKKIKKKDVRVVLEGFDGDVIISHGKGYFNELLKSGRFFKLFNEINTFSKRRKLNPYKMFLNTVIGTIAPEKFDKIWKYIREGTITPKKRERIINSDFAHRIDLDNIIQEMLESPIKKPKTPREFHYNSIDSGLLQFALELGNKISGSNYIETRYPFFDKRLIEFCFGLPTEYKINDGWDRIILRKAMDNILPPEIQWRKVKSKLGANFRRNLISYDYKLIEDIIYNDYHFIEDYVDIDVLKKSYKEYKESKNHRAMRNVWRAVTLALWLRYTKISI